MTYTDWIKRPESERNAEALMLLCPKAKIHYGDWDTDHSYGEFIPSGKPWKTHAIDAKPVPNFRTDRNATDMLLAEVERRGKRDAFDYELGCHSDDVYHAIRSGSGHAGSALGILRIDPSLLTWACVEACKGGAS